MLGAFHQNIPLSLKVAFIDEAALGRLINGDYEIDRKEVSVARRFSSDGSALSASLRTRLEVQLRDSRWP